MTEHLIVLAGGMSSRMKNSQDDSLPANAVAEANAKSKALITLNKRPMLDYVLYNARTAGIHKIIIVTGEDNAHFKSRYGAKTSENKFNGLSISYAVQHIPEGRTKPFGTADAVLQAMEQYSYLKDISFLVCNCDNLYSPEAFEKLRACDAPNALINYDRDALDFSMERVARFALTKTDDHGFVIAMVEKPKAREMDAYKDRQGKFRVSMNIFKFDGTQFFTYLKNCPINAQRNEKELPTALLQMIANGAGAVKAIPLSEHVPDLTSKSDIKQMNAYLSKHFESKNWTR